jgi:hypothetical protein
MHRTSKRRLVGGAAGLLLIGATLLSTGGVALAGQTREITITMSPLTAVTAGGVTRTDVTITNVSGHTLSNAHFLVGSDQVSLPSDVKIVAVFNGDAASCPTITDPVSTLDCSFGNIGSKPNHRTRTLSLAFSVGSGGPYTISVELKVSETGSDVGSNTNYQTASATITPSAATCDALATFLPPGIGKTLTPVVGTDCDTTDSQRSFIVVPKTTDGTLASVDDGAEATGCPTGYSCFGHAVAASVNNNNAINLVWQIKYSNALLGNINPKQVAFDHDGVLIAAGNKGLCKTISSTNCQDPYVVSADGVTFFIRTDKNGLIKGMH